MHSSNLKLLAAGAEALPEAKDKVGAVGLTDSEKGWISFPYGVILFSSLARGHEISH